jgi:hypothetical protein
MKKTASILRSSAACLLGVLLLLLTPTLVCAGSATWVQTPVDNNWNNPGNWMPNTVPNATTDVATFGSSATTAISITAPIDLASATFAAGASPYAITVTNNQTLSLRGSPNIINNSGVEQNFIAEGGTIYIFGSDTLDSTIHFDILGATSARRNGTLWLQGGINLGTARIDFEGSDGPNSGGGYGVILLAARPPLPPSFYTTVSIRDTRVR